MAASVSNEPEHASFARYAEIATTLHRYIEAARAGDGELMRSAFLPEARVRGSYSGKPVDWTVPQFCAAIETG